MKDRSLEQKLRFPNLENLKKTVMEMKGSILLFKRSILKGIFFKDFSFYRDRSLINEGSILVSLVWNFVLFAPRDWSFKGRDQSLRKIFKNQIFMSRDRSPGFRDQSLWGSIPTAQFLWIDLFGFVGVGFRFDQILT